MYPVTAGVKALFDNENKQVLRITHGQPGDADYLQITDADVMIGGFSIDRYACNKNRIEVGTAIASELSLSLDNRNGQYDGVTFEGTELFAEVGVTSDTLVFDDYPSCPFSINSSNKIIKSGSRYAGRQIPVDPSWATITVKANSSAQALCTFVKTELPSNLSSDTDITSYLATGETGRHAIAKGTSETLTVPSDAAFMYFTYKTSSTINTQPEAIYAPVVYWVPCGYFTSYEQPRALNTISIHALDRMCLFDKEVDSTALTFPADVSNLVSQVCTVCGVTLAASITSLPNASFSITELPESDQKFSYRQLIQWCAGLMGTNAWMDWNGQLAFSWFDNATGYSCSTANRFSSDLYEKPIVITGVQFVDTDADETVRLAGTDDYALDISGNLLFKASSGLLTAIYNVVHDYAYTPFTADVVGAPYLWPMDRVTFTDKSGTGHVSMISATNFKLNGRTMVQACGETAETNKLAPPSSFTPAQQQQMRKVERANSTAIRTAVDMATSLITGADGGYVRFIYDANDKLAEIVIMDTEDITTATKVWRWNSGGLGYSSNGYAGPYTTAITQNGAIVADFITTGKLNADRIYGGTLTLGGSGNVNGKLEILDASGNVIGEWNSTVFSVNTAGANGTLRLDGDGGHLSKAIINDLDCPNAAKVYTGPASITVGKSTSTYLSLSDAVAALNCSVVKKTITITLEADVYETVDLNGVCGASGSGITFVGAGYTLYGRMSIRYCQPRVVLNNFKIVGDTSSSSALLINGCSLVHLSGSLVDASGCTASGGSTEAVFTYASNVRIETTALYNATHLINCEYLAHLLTYNIKGGNGTNFLRAVGSVVHMAGTRPAGSYSGSWANIIKPDDPTSLTVDSGTAPTPAPTTTTTTLSCTASGTYYGGWESGNNMLQGRYDNATYAGAMWFNTSAISGKTIRAATLSLRRVNGFGTWDNTNIYLCGTTLTGKSGNPITGYTSYGSIGSLSESTSGTFAVPTTAVQALANGTIKGLMLYIASDTSDRGNIYSDNFSAYTGYGASGAPELTVTYDT